MLASVETPQQARLARALGYRPAMVVRAFPDRRAFHVDGLDERLVPCPAETSERTCVQCGLCLEELAPAIAFQAHGGWYGGADKARRALPVLQSPASGRSPSAPPWSDSTPGVVAARTKRRSAVA